MEMSQLTFYFPSLAVAVLGHVQANTILHSRRLNVKGACVHTQNVKLTALHLFPSNKLEHFRGWTVFFFQRGTSRLTHRCVKSNVLLVRVEILVLLPAELADVAPGFCGQGKQHDEALFIPQRWQLLRKINQESSCFDQSCSFDRRGRNSVLITLKRKAEIERL